MSGSSDTRIGVTVLTGFLGSGKTTLLNRLVAEPRFEWSLVIVNELGVIGVDHHLVQVLSDDVVVLSGGCACCTVRGGLASTLRERFMQALQGRIKRFDHVLIETSGAADPAPILFTLRHDPFLSQRYRYDHTVTVADAEHVLEQLARHPEAARQLALADTLVVTKADRCDAARVADVNAALSTANPTADRIVALAGHPLPQVFLDRLATGTGGGGGASSLWRNWPQGIANMSSARHTAGLSSFAIALPKGMIRSRFYEAIERFQADFAASLLRIKGLVDLAGQSRPFVVHGVHGQLYPLSQLSRWPSGSPDPCLICAVYGANPDKLAQAARQIFAVQGQ